MIIGVPKEIKDNEYRVSVVPAGVKILTEAGHKVIVQRGAGLGSAIEDEEYVQAGAEIEESADALFKKSDLIIKVKEPLNEEYHRFKENQLLFTYLHLAPVPDLTKFLLDRKIVGIAYETIEAEDGSLPLLTPMSEVAGRMSVQVGAHYLEKIRGGIGVLLGGVPGVPPAEVVIIGGGTVGINAAKMALGLGARVTILELSAQRMRYLDDVFGGRVATLMSNSYYISDSVKKADLLIGAVLIHGASAPKLVTRKMISTMKKGSVIVDVAVDQGGCIETTRPTKHSDPVYFVDGVLHYGVANMPGAVPRTSTFALTNVTIPYALMIANMGFKRAVVKDKGLKLGVNTYDGKVTHRGVAESQNLPYHDLGNLL
ncbi:MAG: alanine dehydrogenase [Acidobacteriota bacterium]